MKSAFADAQRISAPISGAQAARRVLDASGLYQVGIQRTGGFLSDHYDPSSKVLRLSPAVYDGHSMAAVGVAAHEAGHAIQDARHYAPLFIRNTVVPMASFGSGISMLLLIAGMILSWAPLAWLGILAFSATTFFQVVNLPVEFDASSRAKQQLATLGIVAHADQQHVSSVLNAAAWTYVAATLQSILTLIYIIMRFGGIGSDD